MKIELEFTENDIRDLLYREIEKRLSLESLIEEKDIKIMVKTTQNYKAEWEVGKFKAVVEKHV